MPKILIEGYENLNQVAMSKAINLNTALGPKESKAITDKLLVNGVVEIPVETSFNIVGLLSALNSANANVKFTE
jgi:hypothetical protein